jgi:predicted DNA-binding transcriptional regulator AlpA
MYTSSQSRRNYESIYYRELLDVIDVAFLMNKSERWVYVHKHQIPGFVKLGGSVNFKKDDVLRWLGKSNNDLKNYFL